LERWKFIPGGVQKENVLVAGSRKEEAEKSKVDLEGVWAEKYLM